MTEEQTIAKNIYVDILTDNISEDRDWDSFSFDELELLVDVLSERDFVPTPEEYLAQ